MPISYRIETDKVITVMSHTGGTGAIGPTGADYVLTSQDKTDIATIVYGMLNNLAQGAY